MSGPQVSIEGQEELSAKLTGPLLDAPLRAAVDAFAESADQGSGLGASVNAITRSVAGGLGARLTSTLNWPRTTGVSWQNTNIDIAERKADQVLGEAGREIEEEFSK